MNTVIEVSLGPEARYRIYEECGREEMEPEDLLLRVIREGVDAPEPDEEETVYGIVRLESADLLLEKGLYFKILERAARENVTPAQLVESLILEAFGIESPHPRPGQDAQIEESLFREKVRGLLGISRGTKALDDVVAVIGMMREGLGFSDAVHARAEERGVSYATVSDKCTRFRGLSASEFKDRVRRYFRDGGEGVRYRGGGANSLGAAAAGEKIPVVLFKKLHGGVPLPRPSRPGDAGADTRITGFREVILDGGERCLKVSEADSWTLEPLGRVACRLGISAAVPRGYYFQVVPRSGLALWKGITVLNAPGTIDAGYRGEWMAVVANLSLEPVELKKGERICQVILRKGENYGSREVDELPDSERGGSGFGSTGRR
jgi:dUTP pyrophosphatase